MITSAIPKLPFIDKQETLKFYVDQIGFKLKSDYADYLILFFDKIELHFFEYPALLPSKSDFMIYLRVDTDIQALYELLQKNNIKIHPNGKLEAKPWNQLEFAITDPNGTLLTFGQAIA